MDKWELPPPFEVELIMEHRTGPDGVLYKIRWAGFGEADDTWEPAANLDGCPEILHAYNEKLKLAAAIVCAPKSRARALFAWDVKAFGADVCVEAFLSDGRRWHTSAVQDVVGARDLRTRSSRYELQGPPGVPSDGSFLHDAGVRACFADGFPADWAQVLLSSALRCLAKGSEPTQEALLQANRQLLHDNQDLRTAMVSHAAGLMRAVRGEAGEGGAEAPEEDAHWDLDDPEPTIVFPSSSDSDM